MANTILTQNLTCLPVGIFGIYQASKANNPNHHLRFNSKIQHNISLPQNSHGHKRNMYTKSWSVFCVREPRETLTLVDHFRQHWKSWILGTIFTILLSFLTKGKWGPLLLVKEKVETTIDEAEDLANTVEEVAERVDNMAEKAVKKIPKGKQRDVAKFVENVAEDTEKLAQNAEDALQKVENKEKELESYIKSSTYAHKNPISTSDAKDKKQKKETVSRPV